MYKHLNYANVEVTIEKHLVKSVWKKFNWNLKVSIIKGHGEFRAFYIQRVLLQFKKKKSMENCLSYDSDYAKMPAVGLQEKMTKPDFVLKG